MKLPSREGGREAGERERGGERERERKAGEQRRGREGGRGGGGGEMSTCVKDVEFVVVKFR